MEYIITQNIIAVTVSNRNLFTVFSLVHIFNTIMTENNGT